MNICKVYIPEGDKNIITIVTQFTTNDTASYYYYNIVTN